MASRPSQDRCLPHSHTHISTSDTLLASRIALPPQPRISYALYKLTSATVSPTEALEHARRSILSRNASASLLHSLLPTVRIDSDPFLYIFRVTHEHLFDGAADELDTPTFDGLSVTERSSFLPQNIASVSPDHDKRKVYSYFYEAVRSRIIDDIVATSAKSPSRRKVKRFKSGFLMSQPSTLSDWEYKAITRPLIFCHLQIHFSYNSSGVPTHLIVHPMLLSTPFLDLPRTLPIPAGTPITLLPYGTPAYFLANYTGPTSGLVKQFQDSLQGMGAGNWADSKHSTVSDTSPFQSTSFVIAWIKVENRQGEDKGTTAIYPANLCVSYMPLSTPRSPLDFVPALPAPLQPSPQVVPAHPSDRMDLDRSLHEYHPLRPSILSSPTSESLHTFRALTLSRTKGLKQVAAEVGGYVDAVARDRERERERLKREREGGANSSPKLTRTTVTTPASAPTPISVDTTVNAPQHTNQYPPNNQPGTSQLPVPVPIQPSISAQMFYPSPPQLPPASAPLTDSKTSPTVESTPSFPPDDDAMVTDTGLPGTEAPLAVDSTAAPLSASNQYEPFGNLDPSWAQSSDNFMGMDFGMDDIEMTFGMNMSNTTSASGAYSEHRTGTGMEFEDAFTDDDFSFFDRPTRPAAGPAATQFSNSSNRMASGSGTQPLATGSLPNIMSPPLFDDVHLSGPGPPNSISQNQQLFTPGAFLDGFTPRSVDHHDSMPPELLPSSPGPTPGSHSIPNTPNVHLEYDPAIKRPGTSSEQSSNIFEPIPFASYHRAADGKYAVGKFAFQLPSPPAEEDMPESAYHSLPTSPDGSNSWRFRYNAITDPRIGVVRKLIGVKRKTPIQGVRDPPKASPWIRAHEEWDEPAEDKEGDDGVKSEAESDEEEDPDDVESPLMSRPTTPLPSYLPKGPTLLHTQFQHAQLLPLSVSLRPPGAAVAPTNLTSNLVPSVPTPVSPAATMGAASEKSKSLEAAAFTIASEVVENPLWAQTWRAVAAGAKSNSSIWDTDVKAISQLLESVPSLEAPCCLGTFFGLDAGKVLQPLEAPMISIGKADSIIQILPTALRFWEKLGLGPKSGRKDIAAFVLFEDDGEVRQTQIANWLAGIGDVYQGKHFGTLSPGKSNVCLKDGLVPLRFDTSFRKALSSFLSSLASQQTVVIFLVLPVTIMTLSSPTLRQIISISKKAISCFEDSHLTFEFVPEQYVVGVDKSASYDSALDMLSSSVYDRIPVSVDRMVSRRIHNLEGHTRNFFKAPLFTLARPLYNRVTYVRAPHTSLDVVDRYTLLHVGYHLTACGKWILAACVDQRGESHALGVWLTQSPGEHDGEIDLTEEEYVIRKIWEFTIGFAKKANVEWRIVIARLGVMTEREQDAWTNQLTVHVLTSREQPPLHVSLVCVEPDASWSFLTSSKLNPTPPSPPQSRSNPPNRTSSASKPHGIFTDVSTTTYVLYPSTRIPISMSPSHLDLGLSQSYIPEPTLTSLSSLPSSPNPLISTNPHTVQTLGSESAAPAPTPMVFPVDPPPEYEPHAITFLPLHTSILVYVPNTGPSTAITMTNIHLLKTFHSRSYTHSVQSSSSSSAVPSDEQLTVDVTKNYHDLAVLARTRWKLGSGLATNQAHAHLPFHLAAVDAMRVAVDRDWDRFENAGEV